MAYLVGNIMDKQIKGVSTSTKAEAFFQSPWKSLKYQSVFISKSFEILALAFAS